MALAKNIAIIIPVAEDGTALERLLGIIDDWDVDPADIVVVDGAHDPSLMGLCRERGCRLIRTQRCRGTQLDAGARAATDS